MPSFIRWPSSASFSTVLLVKKTAWLTRYIVSYWHLGLLTYFSGIYNSKFWLCIQFLEGSFSSGVIYVFVYLSMMFQLDLLQNWASFHAHCRFLLIFLVWSFYPLKFWGSVVKCSLSVRPHLASLWSFRAQLCPVSFTPWCSYPLERQMFHHRIQLPHIDGIIIIGAKIFFNHISDRRPIFRPIGGYFYLFEGVF